MMTHCYTLQLHTGSFVHQMHSFDEITAKAESILKKIKVTNIILGWNTNKELNQQLVQYFHSQGISVLLWLPVLSEVDQIKDVSMMTTVNGQQGERVSVIEHESFSFACPTTPGNVEKVIELYEQYFADIPFDGVFMDKIRFPSFANGYEEGFGCFCEHCQKNFSNIDFNELKELISNHDDRLLKGHYDEYGTYHFTMNTVDEFYQKRASLITQFIGTLAQYFSQRGLIVGADIYAPFLAYHVGQDIQAISQYVDFMKPMMYRYTQAPAGIRYEYEAYIKHFDKYEEFAKHWHDDPASDESVLGQLTFLKQLSIDIYPGIEVNPIENICTVNDKRLRQNLELLKDYPVIALCWDLMQMDESFLTLL